ncbi:chorismate-binding protein [Ascidiimonas aurantiaca]|uniref:chorismate-binding protein n=1 Tax=Ascidiimonas aurantiaca TaxID=1685432 RepID=UPI0030EBAD47
MILDSSIIQKAYTWLRDKKPFVVFKTPENNELCGIFQKDTTLHTDNTLLRPGYVFAPFDSRQKTILFPLESSEFLTQTYETNVPAYQFSEFHITSGDEDTARPRHIELVRKAVTAMQAGSFQKVVLSRKESVPVNEEPLSVFVRLCDTYPSAYVYVWFHPEVGIWMGATPETLLHHKDGRLTTMSLAGTKLYRDSLEAVWGDKEKEEQHIVTSFICKNLEGRVTYLKKEGPFTIRAGNLLHLCTRIEGNCTVDKISGIVNALHPTPAVCGMPREKAKTFILANEPYNRSFYSGFTGMVTAKETRLFVNLRCMSLEDKEATVYVGGGITRDSVPEQEWEETVNKTGTLKKVLLHHI